MGFRWNDFNSVWFLISSCLVFVITTTVVLSIWFVIHSNLHLCLYSCSLCIWDISTQRRYLHDRPVGTKVLRWACWRGKVSWKSKWWVQLQCVTDNLMSLLTCVAKANIFLKIQWRYLEWRLGYSRYLWSLWWVARLLQVSLISCDRWWGHSRYLWCSVMAAGL